MSPQRADFPLVGCHVMTVAHKNILCIIWMIVGMEASLYHCFPYKGEKYLWISIQRKDVCVLTATVSVCVWVCVNACMNENINWYVKVNENVCVITNVCVLKSMVNLKTYYDYFLDLVTKVLRIRFFFFTSTNYTLMHGIYFRS